MSVPRHLVALHSEELADLYGQWSGEAGLPAGGEESLRQELLRWMTDRDRVQQRFAELSPKCRDLLRWFLAQEDYAVPLSRMDEEGGELPVKPLEVEGVAFALKKRGFLAEARDRSWVHFQEPVYQVPAELGDALSAILRGEERTLESQLSLRSFLQGLAREEVVRRLSQLCLSPELLGDRQALVTSLGRALSKTIASLGNPRLRELAARVLFEQGGLGEVRHLERMGLAVEEPESWRQELEEKLLGTVLTGDLTDVGLQLGAGSVVIFLDLVRTAILPEEETQIRDEPEPPADVLADIAAIRTFLDHHRVRVTREGSLYRATLRKMESEVLSPGSRPQPPAEALTFLLRFLRDADLVRTDSEGRMRTSRIWKEFEGRGPVEQTELVLTYVQNDLRGAQGAFHLPRLRRIMLSLLREFGPGRWVALRPLATLARNRYLATLDRQTTADRFQKRYKYVPLPPLATPSVLVRELVRFGGESLALAGIVAVARNEGEAAAIRLTRVGAAVLGLPVEPLEGAEEGALIVTADFEVVLFPEAGGIELVHEVSRFARREKADYSLHYRITERSVQEAVAVGMTAEEIFAVLRRHGRHEIPRNVEQSVRAWADGVHVLEARRSLIVRAPSPETLEAALKVREFRAIAGERLNETTIELSEDPSTPRVAEALRAMGFFLR